MWIVYDEYDNSVEPIEFYAIERASDFIQQSEDPLTWRIQYVD